MRIEPCEDQAAIGMFLLMFPKLRDIFMSVAPIAPNVDTTGLITMEQPNTFLLVINRSGIYTMQLLFDCTRTEALSYQTKIFPNMTAKNLRITFANGPEDSPARN